MTNKYKMVCLDIDGTLLNSKHEITEKTKEAVWSVANERKIPVILVSARMPKGILFLQKELDIVQPVICYSGALILDDSRILSNIAMPAADIVPIFDIATKLSIHMSLYKEDEWYVEKLDSWAQQESEITGTIPNQVTFPALLDSWARENSGPNKILCMAEPGQIQIMKMIIMGSDPSHLNIYPSKETYLEISHPKATKTSAIELLSRRYGVKSSEIIAIGDNYNDINMLEFAGMGIAMGNAPDDVKSCAADVTASNDEDGVAEALNKYILSE